MLGFNGAPAVEALTSWHEFYALLGEASATMIGLLFVAASVASGVFRADRPGAMRIFLSASVVHFSSVLAACLAVLAPLDWLELGVVIVVLALVGLGYSAVAWRDTIRDGIHASLDLEDRCWYAAFPVAVYLVETGSGVMLALRLDLSRGALALSTSVLLVIGIRNAWDITVWSITRRKQ